MSTVVKAGQVVDAAVAWRKGLVSADTLISAVDAYLARPIQPPPTPRNTPRGQAAISKAGRALMRADDVIATVRGGSDRLLTAEEATAALSLRTSRTLLAWARAGQVESIKSPSGKIMFWESYIAEWLRDGDPPARQYHKMDYPRKRH